MCARKEGIREMTMGEQGLSEHFPQFCNCSGELLVRPKTNAPLLGRRNAWNGVRSGQGIPQFNALAQKWEGRWAQTRFGALLPGARNKGVCS